MLKSAQETLANASAIMSPDDPRMKVIDQALWTWILKVLGEIDTNKEFPEIKATLDQLRAHSDFQELLALLQKSLVQELNRVYSSRDPHNIDNLVNNIIRCGVGIRDNDNLFAKLMRILDDGLDDCCLARSRRALENCDTGL